MFTLSPVRREILDHLSELSELVPEIRFGQLVANLSYLARGLSNESIWDMEDAELLEATRKHLEEWRSVRAPSGGENALR
jgi:hypothetical protein